MRAKCINCKCEFRCLSEKDRVRVFVKAGRDSQGKSRGALHWLKQLHTHEEPKSIWLKLATPEVGAGGIDYAMKPHLHGLLFTMPTFSFFLKMRRMRKQKKTKNKKTTEAIKLLRRGHKKEKMLIIEGRMRRAMNTFVDCRKVRGWIREEEQQHMSRRRNTAVQKWSRSSSVTLPGHRTDSQESDVNRKGQQHNSLIGPVDKHCYNPPAAQSNLEKPCFCVPVGATDK